MRATLSPPCLQERSEKPPTAKKVPAELKVRPQGTHFGQFSDSFGLIFDHFCVLWGVAVPCIFVTLCALVLVRCLLRFVCLSRYPRKPRTCELRRPSHGFCCFCNLRRRTCAAKNRSARTKEVAPKTMPLKTEKKVNRENSGL